MKKLMVAAVVVLLGAGAFAKTYYVDPTGGTVSSDDYDGEAEVWDGTHGPRRTLQGIMALAKTSGDVVIALPGVYKEGAMNQGTYGSNRVVVAKGVLLKSRDGAAVTTIEGHVSDLADNGRGADSLRCVYLNAEAVVCGFTLTKGRSSTLVDGGNVEVGGGVCGSGYCVDCVLTGNAARNGSHAFNAKLLRCYLGPIASGGSTPCYLGVRLVDCIYDTTSYAYNNIEVYNSTFLKGYVHASKDSYAAYAYNSLFLGSDQNIRTHHHNCRSVASKADSSWDEDGASEFRVPASSLRYDSETFRPLAGSHALDAGNAAYYARATNGWTKLAQSFIGTDYAGGRRVYNGALDIGAGERNPCEDFSELLSEQEAVTVTNVTSFVAADTNAQAVALGAGETLLGTLNKNGESAQTIWGFLAETEGTGALKVFLGDAVEPQRTVAEADGEVKITYAAADSTALKLVYEGGDGEARVRQFFNHTSVKITAASESIVVRGDFTAVGEYAIAAGETKTFTVARSNEPVKFVRGIEVNGEFLDFNDYPDGKTFTVSGDDVFAGLDIVTVYSDAVNEWFVDAVNGNDETNCGYYANMAFKTLAKAARTAKNTGNIITALPGVYNEGGQKSGSWGGGSNRVVLADGVWLRSRDGAAVTTIEGNVSDQATSGVGTDSMRCAFLGGGAVLSGFTLTKGRPSGSLTANQGAGGAVYGGMCVDCVFSNNVAAASGGNAASSCTLLRCYLGSDPRGSYAAFLNVYLIDSVNNSGKNVRQNSRAYNTTFVSGGLDASNLDYPSAAYNCLFLSTAPANASLYRCYSNKAKGSNITEDDGCKFSQKAEDLAYDPETYRPLKGSIAIDAANAAYYVQATNGWSKLWQSFIGTDYAGGQRVYNGKIDIGAGEYDWRGDFGRTLAKKGVAVAYASEGVTTNEVTGVDLANGEKIVVVPTLKAPGKVSFTVTAPDEGTVTVMRGETELVPEGGVYSFDGVVGENEAVSVAFAGEGAATVSGFDLPKFGVLLIVR